MPKTKSQLHTSQCLTPSLYSVVREFPSELITHTLVIELPRESVINDCAVV